MIINHLWESNIIIKTKHLVFFREVIEKQNEFLDKSRKERESEKDEIDLPPSYSDYEDDETDDDDENWSKIYDIIFAYI